LLNVVLEDGEILSVQISDDTASLLLLGQNADVHQVGSRLQNLIVRGALRKYGRANDD
jgi:hypothetical protein